MTTRFQLSRFLLPLLLLAYLLVVIRTSWLNDDAYITFRTVDNFVNGYGLRWNTVERVQAYTHPLWLFVLTAVYAVTGEIFYTAHWLSIFVSALAVLLLVWQTNKRWETAVLPLLALTLSKAYIDYSTSGLENPLTHLLLVLFFWRYFVGVETAVSPPHLQHLTLIAAAGILNRMDSLLIYLPMLIYSAWLVAMAAPPTTFFASLRRIGKPLLLGFLPLLVWEIFSVVYYGFPFPNTAYAKAFATGVPTTALIEQGLLYFLNALKWDPLTLAIIFLGLIAPFTFQLSPHKHRVSPLLPPALGVLLYLAYILKIGGDFMSGRFLAAPFLVSVLLLMRCPMSPRWVAATAVCLLLLGSLAHTPTFLSGSRFGSLPDDEAQTRDGDIADERRYYYPYTGLLSPRLQRHPWAQQGMEIHASGPPVLEHGNVGFLGFHAGPTTHIVDRNALADPLLARLPTRDAEKWRIGHFRRSVPAGYTEGFWSGENLVADAQLALFYEKLLQIIRGDLFTLHRWQEIWKMNTGQYNHLLPTAPQE